jgi:hypothetical protein
MRNCRNLSDRRGRLKGVEALGQVVVLAVPRAQAR